VDPFGRIFRGPSWCAQRPLSREARPAAAFTLGGLEAPYWANRPHFLELLAGTAGGGLSLYFGWFALWFGPSAGSSSGSGAPIIRLMEMPSEETGPNVDRRRIRWGFWYEVSQALATCRRPFHRLSNDRHQDPGQTSVLVVAFFLVLATFSALIYDGSRALLERQRIQVALDVATLSAASMLDEQAWARSDGTTVQIDIDAARRTAQAVFVSQAPAGASATFRISGDRVEGWATSRVVSVFATLLGVDSISVRAYSSASPRLRATG